MLWPRCTIAHRGMCCPTSAHVPVTVSTVRSYHTEKISRPHLKQVIIWRWGESSYNSTWPTTYYTSYSLNDRKKQEMWDYCVLHLALIKSYLDILLRFEGDPVTTLPTRCSLVGTHIIKLCDWVGSMIASSGSNFVAVRVDTRSCCQTLIHKKSDIQLLQTKRRKNNHWRSGLHFAPVTSILYIYLTKKREILM